MGLLGADTGVVLVVAGVWTLRALAGSELSVAWGIACVGAAARWGALSLVEVEVATRLTGPSVVSGQPVVRVGILLAFAAALASEAQVDGLRARTWPERGAAAAALVALVPLFLAQGGSSAVAFWVLGAPALAAACLFAVPYARRIPAWALTAASAAGVFLALVAR